MIAVVLLLLAASANADGLGLPFDGRWYVAQAGDTPNVNHHMASPAQAYGVDFARVGGSSGRELASANPAAGLSDFYSWGEKVLAPTEGTVVAVVADLPDNPLGLRDTENPLGNHVILRAHEGRFIFLAHLQQGTVSVAPGDRIQRAQPLGLCGNSGNSDFPHIHLHIQETPVFGTGTGQNPIFGPIDVELTGKQLHAVTWPLIRGLFVSNAIGQLAPRAAQQGAAAAEPQRTPIDP